MVGLQNCKTQRDEGMIDRRTQRNVSACGRPEKPGCDGDEGVCPDNRGAIFEGRQLLLLLLFADELSS